MFGTTMHRRLQWITSLSALAAGLIAAPASYAADAWTGGTNLLTDSNTLVKVGIRTAAPKNVLDVKGNAVVGGTYGGTNTAPTDGLRVQGAVVVGTTSNPASGIMLHVAGPAYVSGYLQADGGIKIKGNWSLEVPDYVFDKKTYVPMSLEQVEQYVDANKHLPEIPSADEMKKQGMDVAAMNLLLLKKVEELTLYAIDQDKKLKELSATIAAARPAPAPQVTTSATPPAQGK